MKQLFLPYKLAKLAKEKGFNDRCLTYYGFDAKLKAVQSGWFVNSAMTEKQSTAPLYQQIVDWFREEPRFIQILEQPEKFTEEEPIYCIKVRGSKISNPFPINKAIEEAFKLI